MVIINIPINKTIYTLKHDLLYTLIVCKQDRSIKLPFANLNTNGFLRTGDKFPNFVTKKLTSSG